MKDTGIIVDIIFFLIVFMIWQEFWQEFGQRFACSELEAIALKGEKVEINGAYYELKKVED